MSIPRYYPQATQVIHDIELDIEKHIVTNTVFLSQYDRTIPVIAAHIVKDGQPFNVSIYNTVELRLKKKDGTLIVYDVGLDETGYTVYIPVNEQITIFRDEIPAVLRFTGTVSEDGEPSSGWISTQRFIINVRCAPIQNGDTPSEEIFPDLEERVDALEIDVEELKRRAKRLLYSAKENPTSSDIQTFVVNSGYALEDEWRTLEVYNTLNHDTWLFNISTHLWANQGRPAIVQDEYDPTSSNGMSGKAVASAIDISITDALNGGY